MLNYISTRDPGLKVTPSVAILKGIAPDGGLFVPEDLKELAVDYRELIRRDYRGMASEILSKFFPDLGGRKMEEIVGKSYEGKFSAKELTPLKKVGDAYVLELFHGPTCAFKDVALSILPNLMTEAARLNGFKDKILILTATSGDTGSAALHGFSDVPGTGIIVFFPDGGISDTQKLQMVTAEGRNVAACAVKGNFDDAQSGVKKIFSEIESPAEGISLSSANSINIGRLAPQVVYYFAAYKQLVENGDIEPGDEIAFTVPTGNFGDIMAGWFAKEMGLPVAELTCASNRNDVLTEFLDTGHYNRKREFYKTDSPSMDILISSNLERLLFYVCGAEKTKAYMEALSKCDEYDITKEELSEIRSVFRGVSCDDEEGGAAIGEVFRRYGYLMDTHTSVAWASLEKAGASGGDRSDGSKVTVSKADVSAEGRSGRVKADVVLSTASPYKFTRAVLRALGGTESGTDKENMIDLEKMTGVAIPEQLFAIFGKKVIHKDVIDPADMKAFVIGKSEGDLCK